jgi:hypothetical protein
VGYEAAHGVHLAALQVSYSVEQPVGDATRRWLGKRCMPKV